jgi:hypothetical protein
MRDNRQSRGHMDTWRAQHITFFQCLHIHLLGHSSGVAERRLINFVNFFFKTPTGRWSSDVPSIVDIAYTLEDRRYLPSVSDVPSIVVMVSTSQVRRH